MVNKVVLLGKIGRAPKIALTQDGKEIASFSVATSTSWKDKSGEWQTSTDWHKVSVFRAPTIGWIKDVLRKGDTVYVEGKLSYHCWTDKYGQQRSTPHIMVTGREGRVEQLLSSQAHQQGISFLKVESLQTRDLADLQNPSSDPLELSQPSQSCLEASSSEGTSLAGQNTP